MLHQYLMKVEMMANMSMDQLRKKLATDQNNKEAKEAAWIELFGSKKAFQDSIMSKKPKIPNTWNIIQYQAFINEYVITDLKSFDDWAKHESAYKHYKRRVAVTGNAQSMDSPDQDQMEMINYQELCNDVASLTEEVRNDINEFGVPDLQAWVGAFTTMYFVLKRFRQHFYKTLYTLENEESKNVYQKSPLRHLLLFLIDKRLNKLIPDSDYFKFGKEYFQTFEYRKVAAETIYEYLVEKYEPDMLACKFLA